MQSLNGSSTAVLMNLNDLILNPTAFRGSDGSEPVSLTAVAYLLSVSVNGLGNQTVEPAISDVSNRLCTILSHNVLIIIIIIYTHSEKILLSTASGFLEIAQRKTGNDEEDVNLILHEQEG